MPSLLPCALALVAAGATLPAQDTVKPGAPALVDQARLYIPQFEGDHKPFLSVDEEREARAATNILEAALALDRENAYALWWHGYCCVLLGENERNRGRPAEAAGLYDAGLASFAATLDQDPGYYWAHYSRAMALANLERFPDAIADFDDAVRITSDLIDGGSADDWAPFVRFKARQWRADARLRAFEFDRAREELVAFYADNGNNQWDLGYAVADAYLRESDLAGAREAYQRVIDDPEFAAFDSTYAELAYVAGLLDEREEAVKRIREALERERQPGLYARLWLWILCDGEARAKAASDLEDFLEFPPDGVSEWDRTLGGFAITGEDIGAFLEAADAEQERRMAAGLALDDLMCEVWFYAGLWDERAGRRKEAMAAYRLALEHRPRGHKWEWAYARHRYARLAADLDRAVDPGFTLADGRLTLADDHPAHPGLSGELERFTLHRPGEAEPRELDTLDATELRPGDLIRAILRTGDGERAVRVVVRSQGNSTTVLPR